MKLPNITDKHQRTVWLRAFHIWQCRPHKVAPLSDAISTCASCGTEFRGNYCPRCGQSASIGRFSFRKALLLFLDVWGLGNRGMFRSIRDLALRPGYMIRDYLSGMQSAYFPPFKMFFLLTALSLLVEHGFSLALDWEEKQNAVQQMGQKMEHKMDTNVRSKEYTNISQYSDAAEVMQDDGDDDNTAHEETIMNMAMNFSRVMDNIREKNPAIFGLTSLVLFSLPLFFFIRTSPTIPNLRFAEFIVALVYTANVFSIYSIAGKLLNSELVKTVALLMVFVTFHQLTGFSKKRLLGFVMLTVLISFVGLSALAGTCGFIAYFITGK